jgi:hypothetical protein
MIHRSRSEEGGPADEWSGCFDSPIRLRSPSAGRVRELQAGFVRCRGRTNMNIRKSVLTFAFVVAVLGTGMFPAGAVAHCRGDNVQAAGAPCACPPGAPCAVHGGCGSDCRCAAGTGCPCAGDEKCPGAAQTGCPHAGDAKCPHAAEMGCPHVAGAPCPHAGNCPYAAEGKCPYGCGPNCAGACRDKCSPHVWGHGHGRCGAGPGFGGPGLRPRRTSGLQCRQPARARFALLCAEGGSGRPPRPLRGFLNR